MHARNRRLGKFAALMFTRIVEAKISNFAYASRGPTEIAASDHFSIGLTYPRGGARPFRDRHFWGVCKPLIESCFLGVFRFAKMASIGTRV
jgi:hypothetical protein